MKILETIQKHPYITAGGVMAVLVLVKFGGAASGGNSEAIAATLESQKISSETNVALSEINAQASISRADNAAEMYEASITASTALAMDTNKTLLAAVISGINKTENLAALYSSRFIADKEISSNQIVSLAGISKDLRAINAATESHDRDVSAILQMQEKTLTSTSALQEKVISSSDFQFINLLQATAENLPLINQHAETLAKISSERVQNIASLNTEAQRNVGAAQAKAIKTESSGNFIGDILGAIGSIFGF